jgi:hypothetical protein
VVVGDLQNIAIAIVVATRLVGCSCVLSLGSPSEDGPGAIRWYPLFALACGTKSREFGQWHAVARTRSPLSAMKAEGEFGPTARSSLDEESTSTTDRGGCPRTARWGRPLAPVSLRVIDHGDMAGMTNEEIERAFPGQLTRRSRDKYQWRFPRGESYADADLRAASALRLIAKSGSARPLIVTHEMIGRMLLRNLLDLGPEEALRLGLNHKEIYQVAVVSKTVAEI